MNLSFIKLDINILNDSKIKFIRNMPDGDKIIILWIGILCLGMKSGTPGVVEIGDGIPFSSEMLSTELDIPLNTVRLGLKTFTQLRMIEVWGNDEIFIVNFEKHQALEKIKRAKEISRITSKKHRNKMKQLSEVTVTQSSRDSHVTKSDETERDKDKEEEEDKKEIQETKVSKCVCPHDEIRLAYNRILPELPTCTIRNSSFDSSTRARWREDPERQNIEWWIFLFESIRESDFLMGKTSNGFRCTLDWIVKPGNMMKILNGNYKNRQGNNGKKGEIQWDKVDF